MTEFRYRGTYNWEIEGAVFDSFKAAQIGDEYKSPEFTIGPALRWHLEVHPNGKDEAHKDQCSIRVLLSSAPDHLTNIVTFIQIHCDQLGSDCCSINSFQSAGDASTRYKGLILRSDFKDCSSSIAATTMTLQCTVTILRIDCS